MPTRRTATLLIITQPEQSGGIGTASIAFTRFGRFTSGTPGVAHSVLDQGERGRRQESCAGRSQERALAILRGLTPRGAPAQCVADLSFVLVRGSVRPEHRDGWTTTVIAPSGGVACRDRDQLRMRTPYSLLLFWLLFSDRASDAVWMSEVVIAPDPVNCGGLSSLGRLFY
jgi:hypothetical protein